MRRVIPALMLLLACAPGPDQTRTEPIQNPAPAALRDCATITSRCAGLPALSAAFPALCQNQSCYFRGRDEVLAARPASEGDICGYQAVRADPQPFAIIGIWGAQPDGTRLYRRARFLGRGAGGDLLTKAAFEAACAAL